MGKVIVRKTIYFLLYVILSVVYVPFWILIIAIRLIYKYINTICYGGAAVCLVCGLLFLEDSARRNIMLALLVFFAAFLPFVIRLLVVIEAKLMNCIETLWNKINQKYIPQKVEIKKKEFSAEGLFGSVKTKEQLRKRYRELVKIYHPDMQGGDNSYMEKINAAYDNLLKTLQGQS